MSIKSEYILHLQKSFPRLQHAPLSNLISDNLFSPFSIELPTKVLHQAQKIIQLLFKMREQDSYLNHFKDVLAAKNLKDPGNKSIMMSYDFHLDEEENLKLIEVNTNAAFLALGHQLYLMRGEPLPVTDFSIDEIRENILTELKLNNSAPSTPLKIAIIDEVPSDQRLFVEFLVYDELFKSWDWDSRILDYREVFSTWTPNFIYNRLTDFYLNRVESQDLLSRFTERKVCLSPNPYEYFLLADKQRLIDWTQSGFLQSQGLEPNDIYSLQHVLPGSYDLNTRSAEELWSQRKKLFFKPKNSFGSKQSFRGSSISRKAFEELIGQETIAQEYIPAPERSFLTPSGPQNFKFDLRCYAYQGRLQLIIGRIYQGQVTNLRTPLGGFATVHFK